ncbi:MAG: FAD-binding oxidoreductase [Dehalococcoidia bacterium]|nr:FAD-binding oxidoreductase [Dehalococcoidia bacterium]
MTTTIVAHARIEALRKRLAGALVAPREGDAGGSDSRATRRPALIVRAAGRRDVVETVRFAREERLSVAVRSAGSGPVTHANVDGALVLDLSPMCAVTVDAASPVVCVQPGATHGAMAVPAQAFHLAFGGPDAPAGLGGGIAWKAGARGLSVDDLLAAEVVMGDGAVLRTSPTEHPGLFWAIRSGSAGFGVITEFEFQLPRPSGQPGGTLVLSAVPRAARMGIPASVPLPLVRLALRPA